jgi:UDP-glucose 4-epimerase
MAVLVTGGAGYIGSVVAETLADRGEQVVVLDNLENGHRAAVDERATFLQADLDDRAAIEEILGAHRVDCVVHLAAYAEVAESVELPGKYYRNNVTNGLTLLDAMVANGVHSIVFSSTAAVYGTPEQVPITEQHPTDPDNPYGWSKLAFEKIIDSYYIAYGMSYVSLRYFNAAGATQEHGEDHRPETHLIPRLLEVAAGKRDKIEIFGSEFDTKDGTCVRDYVHVKDIAAAHLLALDFLRAQGQTGIFNLGNGNGFSNLEVVEAARVVTGEDIRIEFGPPRPGDPASLVASSEKVRSQLGWDHRTTDLDAIISSAWNWMRAHPSGYKSE